MILFHQFSLSAEDHPKNISDIRNAKSATQAQDLIAQARSDGNQYQAAHAEKHLAILCSSGWDEDSVPGISFHEKAAEKIIAYCDGWFPSRTIEELTQEVSSRSDPAFNEVELHKLLTVTEPINRSELIKDLVNTARTPLFCIYRYICISISIAISLYVIYYAEEEAKRNKQVFMIS